MIGKEHCLLEVNRNYELARLPDNLDDGEKITIGGAGQIIMVSGLPGSGKSVVAKKLCSLLTGECESMQNPFRTDNFRHIALQGIPKVKWYTKENNLNTYKYMFDQAIKDTAEFPVVLDATFADRNLRHLLYNLVPESMKVYRIHVISPDLFAREWMSSRLQEHKDPSEADYNVRREIAMCFDPFQNPFIVINNNSSLDALRSEVKKLVRR